MIKVLNIISDTNIGGAGKTLINFASAYDRDNFDVSFALPKGSLLKPLLEKYNVVIYEVDGMADRSYSKDDVVKLEKLIKEVRPDIVHTHGALSGRIAGRRCGCKVIYTRHSVFPVPNKLKYPPGRWVNKFVNEHYADKIIAISPSAEKNLTDMGISKKYITVMMNGVDAVPRVDDNRINELKKQYGIETDDFVMLLLARIEEYKGHRNIIEAAEKLKADGRKFKIIFAGKGGYEETAKKLVKEKNLEENIVFAGFISDVSGILSITDLQLNASTGTETSSLSILEGFSMGLPCVVSSYGGNPVLVRDGFDGIIFEAGRSDALYEAMKKVMDDKKLLSEMGQNALVSYKTKYTAQVFSQNIQNVYTACING